MSAPLAIQIDKLRFAYDAGKPVLAIENWQVKTQERVFLYGPSGCGKSTLLSLMSGLLVPNEGSITIDETLISSLKPSERDSYRAQHIGVVLQQFNLVPYLSVIDNIKLACYFSKNMDDNSVGIEEHASELLLKLQLPLDLLHQRADALSVGQQQRIAIARALINTPRLMIVDEPTSALDEDATSAFMDVLLETVHSCKASLIFVSHDKRLSTYFDRVQSLPDLNEAAK
ncbi:MULTISPECIES: ATP-binding cassette domain-containing protein [Alteromonadaceae]|uniref:ATP-binding cassette domain-containing protein n=1 Tax=Brumicola blandensis TaxID=3075611 RepID=A0AAW8R371_9ALTE|nr:MULTISPECIES: ATP-binding cassette domain-containing protein [unclassified Alteromonas]MDT0582300.1 ATP-binding cassette domain-containing protein [Alteromonas sp. W409]MDT0628521.1 ATP-binding cassette domain-containing protein [Alteromonas sp. W364]